MAPLRRRRIVPEARVRRRCLVSRITGVAAEQASPCKDKGQTDGWAMRKLQVAVIGLGRLGNACANALIDDSELVLAGVVRRPEMVCPLRDALKPFPAVAHVRDLPTVDVALICVPATVATGVAWELLQARIPIVECALLEDRALEEHHARLDDVAKAHRVAAIVAAGWNPGMLQLFDRAFETLIPRGQEVFHRHPGITLHHSAAAAQFRGVKDALAGEFRTAEGSLQRYVYVQLEPGADFEEVQTAIEADPLFAGEASQIFQVDDLSGLEAGEGQGVVLERRSAVASGVHTSLLLEARFELAAFAARVMLDGARKLPLLRPGAHRYALNVPGHMAKA
jgi:diaminopimelate dehydrogenase